MIVATTYLCQFTSLLSERFSDPELQFRAVSPIAAKALRANFYKATRLYTRLFTT